MTETHCTDRVSTVEVFLVDLSQDKPYLGNLRPGETVNASGYFVRQGNQTVYPRSSRSLAVRLTTRDGIHGWGETYGLVAPEATAAIISDLLTNFVVNRDPMGVEAIHDELYGLMRVRGYTGGFYLDALAAIDIALWDICGKIKGVPVCSLLGQSSSDATIPAYVSGLPEDTLPARCDLALSWQEKGFDAFKFAMPVADEGCVAELALLRERLGDQSKIACDMHWAYSEEDALEIAGQMAPYCPWFLEAPVAPEEIELLRAVATRSGQKIAAGEEWRTIFEARLRIDREAVHIVQPEMGHTGITQFMRIARYASDRGLQVIPHATIGAGIFLAASLHASAALGGVESHEFQHSIFGPFRHFTGDALRCERGFYNVPEGRGLGVEPSKQMLDNMVRL